MKNVVTIIFVLGSCLTLSAVPNDAIRTYEIWEPEPAPNNGRSQWEATKSSRRPRSHDRGWERWSYPIGNGYAGACVFGRTDTERIQITDKTLHNKGIYGKGGLTSFAEVFLDFNQNDVQNYRRSLNLNEAIAHVSYERDGVTYKREYFASYPDNVIVIRLTADQKGALSFTVRPEIPYLALKQRSGSVTAKDNLLTLKGTIALFSCNYEGQIKVLNEGGSVSVEGGTVEVRKADAVTLLIATGTNYELSDKTFSNPPAEKLDPKQFPHDAVTARIQAAEGLGYAALKERHLRDVQNLFGRVSVNLNSTPSADPTHLLLGKYQKGETSTWLEELMFQYGRYLLMASSREKSLPANLQGAWSQDFYTPWTGGFWHNINVQMNYWGAMSANLSECFEAYIAFFEAYLPLAQQHAADYVRKHNSEQLMEGGDNGWIIGTGANAYYIPGAGGHSGPGTGGFTAKLLMDYYQFTQDREFLEEVAYPAMLSLSRFYAKVLIAHGELLLVEPSASPEQTATPEQAKGMPGHISGRYYITAGCTFDQGFVWESFNDTLVMADTLGRDDPFLDTIREQIKRLDPIRVGADGQVKEYREENHYSDIGQARHRHISHLCPLFPGTLINSERADWMQAASKTLDLRGNRTTGWALAHRMNCRARLGEGDNAHEAYQTFIRERTLPNLWTVHPPFQIDGSLGVMAGVAEMLLQSHEAYINILPALPEAWNDGHFDGLVARGNFVVSAKWTDGKATEVSILSRRGGECRVACSGIGTAAVTDNDGNTVKVLRDGDDRIRFASTTGGTYTVAFTQKQAGRRAPENGFGIVPMPYQVKAVAGKPFVITQDTVIIGRAAETKNCAAYLQQRLRRSCGLTLRRRGYTDGTAIVVKVADDATAFSENDAYRLESNPDRVTISAKTERGLFYGVQSLLQLLPPAVYGDTVKAGLELKVPALVINDKPSMDRLRGLHVDISRHFRSKEELLKIIDSMAIHKLNAMHLHATDVQGWRIEIKAYPKLTTVGATGNKTDPEAPATFLTQEEVKEIVAYARSRYISIFPEIDMPGHMGAAIRAYPELNHPKDVNDKQFAIRGDAMGRDFAKTVLREINELFNADYIHIGFDEVNYGAKAELYTDAELLDFVEDITSFIKEDLKRTPIVWDDIFMHGFDDKASVVQWWRYGKNYWWKRLKHTVDEELNTRQQPFILSPAYWTYFDMKNLKGGWAKPLSAAEVYNWDPFGDMLGKTEHTRELALGAIACTWSEKIPTMKDFGDRTYPRLASFSERIWRGGKLEAPEILSWPDYRDQVLIPFQLKRYDALGVHYWSKDKPELLLSLPDERKQL